LTPESFARTLCSDLGLSGESVPLIAHAIHEEILRHKRDAVEWNVISAGETTAVDPEEEREKPRDRSGMSLLKDKTGLGMGIGFGKRGEGRGPRSLKGVFRDWSDMEEWGTKLEELTAEEVERREIERERAARYAGYFLSLILACFDILSLSSSIDGSGEKHQGSSRPLLSGHDGVKYEMLNNHYTVFIISLYLLRNIFCSVILYELRNTSWNISETIRVFKQAPCRPAEFRVR